VHGDGHSELITELHLASLKHLVTTKKRWAGSIGMSLLYLILSAASAHIVDQAKQLVNNNMTL